MQKGTEQAFVGKIKDMGPAPEVLWESLKKNNDNLVPAITQDSISRDVLMLAYMDRVSFLKTLETGIMHYYSRSKGRLWMKGETSGHVQRVVKAKIDCDLDTLLFVVEQTGAACHTGNKDCFYRSIEELAEVPKPE